MTAELRTVDPETALTRIARSHGRRMSSDVGEALRRRRTEALRAELALRVNVSRARIHETLVTLAQEALRCGALLDEPEQTMPADVYANLLRGSCIGDDQAQLCVQLARTLPALARQSLRRRWHISLAEAAHVLALLRSMVPPRPAPDIHELVAALSAFFLPRRNAQVPVTVAE